MLLKYLKLYSFDHHSRAIANLQSEFIDKNLPEYQNYLESRVLETNQTKQLTRGLLKNKESGMIQAGVWHDQTELKKYLFQSPVEAKEDGEGIMEPLIKAEFIDIPGVYHQLDASFIKFYEALG